MKNDGKDLQRLIHAIEGARNAGKREITIESPKRLRDKDTGKLREHDVVLTVTHEHHEFVIALECRDRWRPVGVDAVEAFANKCRRTGVDQGIIVSGKGFYATALLKAAQFGVRCLTLDEVEGFDWCPPRSISILHSNVTHSHLEVEFLHTAIDGKIPLTLTTPDGSPITPEIMNAFASSAMGEYVRLNSHDQTPGEHRISFKVEKPPLFAMHNGVQIQALRCTLLVTYTFAESNVPFAFREYIDAGKSTNITQAAIASMPTIDDLTPELVLSTDKDGRIHISMVPSPPAGKTKKR